MTSLSGFLNSLADTGAVVNDETGRIERFGSLEAEYEALRDGVAIVDRGYSGLVEVTGKDRLDWLHNLTTNHVKNLARHEGNYAFVLNVQGRILFDVTITCLEDACWVGLNRCRVEGAIRHFDKYTITEDVRVSNRSDDFARLGLAGPKVPEFLGTLGLWQASALPSYGYTEVAWNDVTIPLIRKDSFGPFGVELFLPPDRAVDVWNEFTSSSREPRAVPVGDEAAEIHRIEAGIPCPIREFAEDIVPAETAQLARAVSFNKGCYLGQEVVERMRSRGVVARLLSGLTFDGNTPPPFGADLHDMNGGPVGRVTSTCHSIAKRCVIGLGYIKTSQAEPGTEVRAVWREAGSEERSSKATVTALPFSQGPAH